ncbi:ribosomal RNA processing protein 36 homolog [Rhinophrynus dorsalis]
MQNVPCGLPHINSSKHVHTQVGTARSQLKKRHKVRRLKDTKKQECKRSLETDHLFIGSSADYSPNSEDDDPESQLSICGTDRDPGSQEEDPNTQTVSTPETSTLSFEELIELQNKVGTKLFYKTVRGEKEGNIRGTVSVQGEKKRPLELSSKRPVPFLRKVVQARKEMRRDPRFDDLSGEYKPEVFEKTYRFINDVKKKEKELVQKKLRKVRDPQMKEKLEQLLKRMDHQEECIVKKQKQRDQQLEFKRQQRVMAQQGKKPFYMKKGDLRKLELADKYQELKKRGKLEHFLSKKRKRNSYKDRRRLPNP